MFVIRHDLGENQFLYYLSGIVYPYLSDNYLSNNYESTHRNFWKEQILLHEARNQKCFHEHYLQNDHNEICD